MNLKQAKKELMKIGFTFSSLSLGRRLPEPYSNNFIKNNCWTPKFRDVFISHRLNNTFYYITSDLYGSYLKNGQEYDNHFANIFTSGKTLKEAVTKFIFNMENKIYNIT